MQRNVGLAISIDWPVHTLSVASFVLLLFYIMACALCWACALRLRCSEYFAVVMAGVGAAKGSLPDDGRAVRCTVTFGWLVVQMYCRCIVACRLGTLVGAVFNTTPCTLLVLHKCCSGVDLKGGSSHVAELSN